MDSFTLHVFKLCIVAFLPPIQQDLRNNKKCYSGSQHGIPQNLHSQCTHEILLGEYFCLKKQTGRLFRTCRVCLHMFPAQAKALISLQPLQTIQLLITRRKSISGLFIHIPGLPGIVGGVSCLTFSLIGKGHIHWNTIVIRPF